jgi:hypothetical protein
VSGAGSNQATYPSFRIDVQRPNIAGADDRDFRVLGLDQQASFIFAPYGSIARPHAWNCADDPAEPTRYA